MNGSEEIRMRTEDDLRAALATLEQHAPTTESVLRPIHQPARRTRSCRRLSKPRLVAATATVTAAAAALAVVAVQSGGQASHQEHGVSQAYLTAWSVQRPANGLIKIEIRQLKNATGLQAALRADGVPANVVFPRHSFEPTTSPEAIPRECQPPNLSDEANAKLQGKIMPPPKALSGSPNSVVLIIRPSAIPPSIGLFIEAFSANPKATPAFLSMQTNLVETSPQCTGS